MGKVLYDGRIHLNRKNEEYEATRVASLQSLNYRGGDRRGITDV